MLHIIKKILLCLMMMTLISCAKQNLLASNQDQVKEEDELQSFYQTSGYNRDFQPPKTTAPKS